MTATPNADQQTSQTERPGRPVGGAPQPGKDAPVFNLHGLIVALSAACILVHLARLYVLSPEAEYRLVILTAFFPLRYMPETFAFDLATVVSPVTYAFLHGDWVHLTINLIWLAVFGSPVAYRIGWIRGLLFWIVTAGFAALTHLAIYYGDPVPVIGASGAVSGFMGAAARFGLRANRLEPRKGFDGPLLTAGQALRARGVFPFLLVWVVMNVAVGTDFLGLAGGSGIAWEAHIGGLLAGFLLIPVFDRRPQPRAL